MSWAEGLHKKQIEAAEFSGAHARLIAGPGTGKTITLVKRVTKLVSQDGITPEDILVIVFTRVNAFDLRGRLMAELEKHTKKVPRVSTLHSYALRQLLLNSRLLTTLPQPLRIADDFEEKYIIRSDLAKTLDISDKKVRSKLADMSSDWQSLAFDEPGFTPADPKFLGAWRDHRTLFGYTLRSELIWQLKHAMEENPDTFKVEGEIKFLLVDEYQDLNMCDLEVIKKLSALGAEVFGVGDDDQSIYYFRRAHPAGIRGFPDDYSPSVSLGLEVCWRCDKQIIEIGQFVANQDPLREPKPIQPRPDAGEGEVHLLQFDDQVDEANGVALISQYLLTERECQPDDILILLRSDHQGRYSNPLIEALSRRDLSCKVRGERWTILDKAEGRYFLSTIRLLANGNDDLALRTMFQYVARKNNIGEKTIEALLNYAKLEGLRFAPACLAIESDPQLVSRGNHIAVEMKSIRQLISSYENLIQVDASESSDEDEIKAIRAAMLDDLSKLSKNLIDDEAIRDEVMSHITDIALRSNWSNLSQLLGSITSPEDTLDQELEKGKINILSMHRAKGLSAKAVILVGAESQLIPGDSKGEEFNDARRLLYVSLTRAKEFLYITYCNRRTGRQRHSGSDAGNPVRTLTPFLRGGLPVTSSDDYLGSFGQS